jgi:hypothetical protein
MTKTIIPLPHGWCGASLSIGSRPQFGGTWLSTETTVLSLDLCPSVWIVLPINYVQTKERR